jgi:hypothetical protein
MRNRKWKIDPAFAGENNSQYKFAAGKNAMKKPAFIETINAYFLTAGVSQNPAGKSKIRANTTLRQ